MLKFIIISILVIYLFVKISGFILKTIFRLMYGQTAGMNKRKPQDGNVYIDFVPEENNKKKKKKKNFSEGEYVEYEEIK